MTDYLKIEGSNLAISTSGRKWQKVEKYWFSLGSIVVESSTHNPKIEGSNPAIGTSKKKWHNVKKYWFLLGSTVVEHSTHHPKI
jgi:hypothetical protein